MSDEENVGERRTLDWEDARRRSLLPGGFGQDRVALWKSLLNVPDYEDRNSTVYLSGWRADSVAGLSIDSVEEHADERQIKLDTDRSFVLYPEVKSKEQLQAQLHDLIVALFRKRRHLSYFQGYHDIISVLFLTLPEDILLASAEKMSLHRLRDSMGSNLEPVIALVRVLQRLLSLADPNFAEILQRTSPLPYYALSNLLTLFSHDLPTLSLAQHAFDYLLSRPPIAAVYLAAAMLLSRKAEVELLEQEGEDGMIHSLLCSLPDLFDSDEDNGEASEDEDILGPVLEEMMRDISSSEPAGERESQAEAVSIEMEVSIKKVLTTVQDLPDTFDSASSRSDYAAAETSALAEVSFSPDLNNIPSDEAPGSSDAYLDEQPQEPLFSQQLSEDTQDSRPPTPPTPPPPRPRMSLISLLQQADLLYELYPPSHPSIALDTILGPQSVMFTWSENPSQLPQDDEAELMATKPDLVVHPVKEESEEEEEGKEKEGEHRGEKRRRRRLRKPHRLVPSRRKAMVASAVLVLGIAVAVYGTGGFRGGGIGDSHRPGHREWRTVTKFIGALFVGAGERLLDSIWG
ncbi:unnamed protein product [Somion occarium]|uniref:Rab-GAP TBC domain-containing protein n=1 Tax=Somion occarium TaxID=3059160 RepID=A0ABP1CVG0_9APHY